jgi:hypothetical protein
MNLVPQTMLPSDTIGTPYHSNPFCHGGASNGHYGGNAETYMDIGEAMGRAMVELLNAGT